MAKHHHPQPLYRRHHHEHDHHDHDETPSFNWLLELLKKVLQFEPDINGNIKGDFACPEASYFNQKINTDREASGKQELDIHDHNPVFTEAERASAVKEMAREMRRNTAPMPVVSQKPNEIIYGNAGDPDKQLKYTFSEGKWLITPGSNVDAIIIDPAGKVIEIKPGPHIHEYGKGGNLVVTSACKGHHDEHHHHDHDGPCSSACGHGAKSHEHQHVHGRNCSHG